MLARTARNALAKTSRPPFRFRGCLNAKKEALRASSRNASTLSKPSPASSDDADIIADFDLPRLTQRTKNLTPTGLFGHGFLTTPWSFVELADSALRRADLLTQRIVRARESRDELAKVVKHLDRLSDMLCGVIDLAELVRNAHSDPEWVQSAEHVYEKMCEFMNVLNTHVDLYLVRTIAVVYCTFDIKLHCLGSSRGLVKPGDSGLAWPRGTRDGDDILERLREVWDKPTSRPKDQIRVALFRDTAPRSSVSQ